MSRKVQVLLTIDLPSDLAVFGRKQLRAAITEAVATFVVGVEAGPVLDIGRKRHDAHLCPAEKYQNEIVRRYVVTEK